MSLTNVFRDIAIKNAQKQTKIIDKLTEDAPLLATLPMSPATHGIQNVYEELIQATGSNIVNLDESLPTISADGDLLTTNLSVIGGIMEVGEDKARKFGGPEAYFATKMPAIMRQSGMDIEASFIYNNFRSFASTNSKLADAEGSDNVNYSMVCVKFVDQENTGLYDPEGFGDGKIFDFTWLSDGALYKNSSNQLVYGIRVKNYFGIQLANSQNISGIVNIDLTDDATTDTGYKKLPSIKQVNDMITDARGTTANTVIWAHPKVIGALNMYKPLSMNVQDENLSMKVSEWNDVTMIGSYNFLDGTETNVSV